MASESERVLYIQPDYYRRIAGIIVEYDRATLVAVVVVGMFLVQDRWYPSVPV